MPREHSHTNLAYLRKMYPDVGGGAVQDVATILDQPESVGDVLHGVMASHRKEEWLEVLENQFNADYVSMLLDAMHSDQKFLAAVALDTALSSIPSCKGKGRLRELSFC